MKTFTTSILVVSALHIFLAAIVCSGVSALSLLSVGHLLGAGSTTALVVLTGVVMAVAFLNDFVSNGDAADANIMDCVSTAVSTIILAPTTYMILLKAGL